VTVKNAGTAVITVTHPDIDTAFTFTVRAGSEFVPDNPAASPPSALYFTAERNVLDFTALNTTKTITVTPVNLPFPSYNRISWWCNNTSIASVIPNGNSAAVTAAAEGVTTITVTHPDIDAAFTFTVRAGNRYASDTPGDQAPPIYFTAAQNVFDFTALNTTKTVTVTPVNLPFPSYSAISWKSDNTSVASLIPNGNSAAVTVKSVGTARITVSHPDTSHSLTLTVRVSDTPVYFTIADNTLSFTSLNSSETVSVIPVRMDPASYNTISWTIDNPSVASLIPNGNSAAVTALSDGTARITVSHPDTPNTVTITVAVNSRSFTPLPAAKYFTTAQNVLQFPALNTVKTASVTAVNLDPSRYNAISWRCDNPSVASVLPNGTSAAITSLSEGTAVVTVSHPDVENSLSLSVRVGAEFVIVNPSDPFIAASRDVVSLSGGGQGFQLSAELRNGANTSGFSWIIDGASVASISPLGSSCFIVPKAPGQTLLTISHPDAAYPKKVLVLVDNPAADAASLPYLTTGQNQVLMPTGTQQTVSVRIKNNETAASGFSWNNDGPAAVQVIASGPQARFKALSPGVARITVTHPSCEHPLEITAIVTDDPADAGIHPYITSSQNIVTVTKGGDTKTVAVTLAGGTVRDNQHFSWRTDNPAVVSLTANGENAVIRGLSAGECRITVSHPKASYDFPVVVICEEALPSSSLYISPSHPILTMKPADAEQTVSASLIGGTAEDRYGFTWYADNYNVIDLTYQANTAVIRPKEEGTAEITISHPKAGYDGKMTVRVTEYSVFAFAQTAMTVTEGTTQFVSMRVPAMDGAYSGRITYTTDNAKIVTVTGTNKVAQITAVGTGTAVVNAVSPSGAKSEMMVYVQKAAETMKPYITSTTSVLAMKAGEGQRSVTASLVGAGVVQTDQYNLKWETDNPAVASLTGSTGTNVLVKPVGAGETTIRISHEKTDSIFTLYVQVEGTTKGILLNKNYLALDMGKTGELAATITDGTSDDYRQINWTADKVNGTDVVSILGNGKTVAIYGIHPGRTRVTAEFNGNTDTADVLVQAARQFTFNTQTMRIQPGQTKTFSYTLVPDDAMINWVSSSNDYISYGVDTSSKTVTVTGVSDGNSANGTATKLSAAANGFSASITITCAWDYVFTLGKSLITGDPRLDPAQPDKFVIPYEVNPANAGIEVQITRDIAAWVIDTAGKKITLTPRGEGEASLVVTAVNPVTGAKFLTRNVSVNLNYASLTLRPSQISVNGNFSRYDGDGGTIVLGDGEDLTLKLDVEEMNTNYTLNNVRFTGTSSESSSEITVTDRGDGIWNIRGPKEVEVNQYTVFHDVEFYYKGKPLTLKGGWTEETMRDKSGTEKNYYRVETNTTEKLLINEYVRSTRRSVHIDQSTIVDRYYYIYRWTVNEPDVYLVMKSPGVIVTAVKVKEYKVLMPSYVTVNEYWLMAGDEDDEIREGQTSGSEYEYYYTDQYGISSVYIDGKSDTNYSPENFVITKTPKNPPKQEEEATFRENPKWYVNGFIINDTARYETSPSTAVRSSTVEGYLSGTIGHNGTNQAFQIPVVVETRGCLSGAD
jgi:hypothetical protein